MAEVVSGGLRVTGAPVVLLLDAQASSAEHRDLTNAALGLAARGGSDRHLGVLSDTQIHETLPDDAYIVDRGLLKKGRFVTPLVEAGLLDHIEGASLLVFSAGRVPDWTDWDDDIRARALRVLFVRLGGPAWTPPELTIDLSSMPTAAAEVALRERLENRPSPLRLVVEGGWIFSSSSPLQAVASDRGVEWLLDTRGTLEHKIAIAGPAHTARVCLYEVGGADALVDTPAARLEFPTTEPEELERIPLPPDEAVLVREAMPRYLVKASGHHCPLCNEGHSFDRAFLCEERDTFFVDPGANLILSPLGKAPPGSRFLLEVDADGCWLRLLPVAGVALAAGHVFARDAEDEIVLLEADNGQRIVASLEHVMPGLLAAPELDVYVVET